MTLRTALLFPGVASVVFFTLNILIWGQDSSGAVSFSTLFALSFLWFGVSVPLVFTGSYFGFKRAPEEEPVRTNKIPRQVSDSPLDCVHGCVQNCGHSNEIHMHHIRFPTPCSLPKSLPR